MNEGSHHLVPGTEWVNLFRDPAGRSLEQNLGVEEEEKTGPIAEKKRSDDRSGRLS